LSNWRGPISLAVSLHGEFGEEFVEEKIKQMLRRVSNIADASRLSVHVMFERVQNMTCEESSMHLTASSEEGVFHASYPINTVRNVARLFSSTRYIAFADADYLFSIGFYEKMVGFLRGNVPLGSKNALVYRIFEVDEDYSRLRNNQMDKVDLKAM
ncbi:hypothetical protein PMAYCL1PPCAC_14856, partial [Pristionchus mayeri]